MSTPNRKLTRRSNSSMSPALTTVLGSLLLLSQSANSNIQLNPHPYLKAGPNIEYKSDIESGRWTQIHHSRILPSFLTSQDQNQLHPWRTTPATTVSFGTSETALDGLGDRHYVTTKRATSFRTILSHYEQSGDLTPENATPMFGFDSVGFPNIVTAKGKSSHEYKPYEPLLKMVSTKNGNTRLVPNIRCHGYSVATTARQAAKYEKSIEKYASRYSVNPDLVKAVVTKESCFRVNAKSHVGATGLMQLMPETAKWLGIKNINNADENLRTGIRYLAQLKRRFGSDELALAAYNAGPGNVKKYKGIPPFAETQGYVKAVMSYSLRYSASRAVNANTPS